MGRHLLGSQIFDYWRDLWGLKHEHYADGDVFDASQPVGYHKLDREGLYQWGPDLPDDFLVMNGDVLTDLAFDRFLDEHRSGKQLFTISAAAREQTIDYGVLQMGTDGYLAGFEEKPKTPYCVSMATCISLWCKEHRPGSERGVAPSKTVRT